MRMHSKLYSHDSNSNTDHYYKILSIYYPPDTVSDILHASPLYPGEFDDVFLSSIYR